MFKQGTAVRILRKNSFWYNTVGVIGHILDESSIKYGIYVKFNTSNYSELRYAYFRYDELIPAE
jgi:photosystem I subunit 4